MKPGCRPPFPGKCQSHSARSAWIETPAPSISIPIGIGRTPQGVRGLKPPDDIFRGTGDGSHSARSAWIETLNRPTLLKETTCRTPQGVRGLKRKRRQSANPALRRTPQGVRGLKRRIRARSIPRCMSHSARSAWIETGDQSCPQYADCVALRKECVD